MEQFDRGRWLEDAMDRWEQSLLRICYAYLGDVAMAEDAVQETFLKAWTGIDRFRGGASEKTWLMRIAVNTCHSMRRTGWMRFIDRRVSLDKLPEPAVHADYGLSELTLEIMRLPQKLIDVVMLHDYQGFTIRETGELLGIPHQTAASRICRAHRMLRFALTDDPKGGTQP